MDPNQRVEDDLKELGLEIRIRDERIKSLDVEKKEVDNAIIELKDTLAKYRTLHGPIIDYVPNEVIEEETVQQILKHNSAAAVWYKLKDQLSSGCLQDIGVVGIVATLGKVEDGKLSRLLSEYLGTRTMLTVVCDNLKHAIHLESCNKEGSIVNEWGIRGLGEAIGRTIDGRFQVICLETLRPYDGDFIAGDLLKRLDLPLPKLASGDIPHGFLGFAVNMIFIDRVHLSCTTPQGHGIRETLFYHLFSRMQIYRTRQDMNQALPCITHGAISLDGGLIKTNGVFSFGNVEEIDVIFPRSSEASIQPADYFSLTNQLEGTKYRRKILWSNLQRERLKQNYNLKKQERLGSGVRAGSAVRLASGVRPAQL